MNKIQTYIAIAAVGVFVAIGIFLAGSYSGKLSVANQLITLKAERADKITELTLELVGKQKIIDAQQRKTLEVIRNAEVDSCADTALPAVFADILR